MESTLSNYARIKTSLICTPIAVLLCVFFSAQAQAEGVTGDEIIRKLDRNYAAENRRSRIRMTIRGQRRVSVMESESWVKGTEKSYTEYISPARQKGTKMLKIGDELWIYSPDADRIIKIAGHMLRKSMMGSDLSYEDMMEDQELLDIYNAMLVGEESLDNAKCYKVELKAKPGIGDIAYDKRILWVDKEKYLPSKEELFAKSGKLLKKMTITDAMRLAGRWYPRKMVYKDMLSSGDGTEFEILSVQFDVKIPETLFTKASLRK